MYNSWAIRKSPLFWGMVVMAAFPPLLSSQSVGTIRGMVHSAVTGEPLAGVRVIVEEAALDTITDAEGVFLLSDVPAGSVRIRLEHTSEYVTTTEQIAVRPGVVTRVSLELLPRTVLLDELLVRGRPAPTDGTVREFEEGEARRLTGGGTAVDLLVASFSSVQVNRTSGQAGAGTSLLIRGTNSLILSGEPLVYLDGVRIGSPTAPGSPEAPMILGFLDQIPADMVVRIEILKGPSATRFGIGSSNGVILIYTR